MIKLLLPTILLLISSNMFAQSKNKLFNIELTDIELKTFEVIAPRNKSLDGYKYGRELDSLTIFGENQDAFMKNVANAEYTVCSNERNIKDSLYIERARNSILLDYSIKIESYGTFTRLIKYEDENFKCAVISSGLNKSSDSEKIADIITEIDYLTLVSLVGRKAKKEALLDKINEDCSAPLPYQSVNLSCILIGLSGLSAQDRVDIYNSINRPL